MHLLWALAREEEGVAGHVLRKVVEYDSKITEPYEVLDEEPTGQIPFTENVKRIFELALREALSLGHNYIGTEHILLAIIRHANNDAYCLVLRNYSTTTDEIRQMVIRMTQTGRPEIPQPAKSDEDASNDYVVDMALLRYDFLSMQTQMANFGLKLYKMPLSDREGTMEMWQRVQRMFANVFADIGEDHEFVKHALEYKREVAKS